PAGQLLASAHRRARAHRSESRVRLGESPGRVHRRGWRSLGMDGARGARSGAMDRLSPERAEALLAAIGRARVLVVGDLMLDRDSPGVGERVSPEAPVPVVRVEEESSAGGGAGNVAANVAALGAACRVVGLAGDDASGEALRAELEGLG